ncbi:Cytochrome c oxidase polypeptide 4 [Austwickia sp. TVS 96-490-7B]|uniref:cytochrome c oxidase subunit 4 n=1 Tax=Austwickia sp. TVS 96-490-7B TaxID=2830843 RepID=UPI001C566F82|nr:cytochrome c oxidase subunit 4 [Austwickia sp. TVS 96-490-7B]MBW3086088.1 Cytochrome c oxidase polypeptide 4 [Austwickia sp. TVS 96-490-7B]
MRIETKLFQYGAVPFLIVAAVYGWATWKFTPTGVEPVGVVCIGLTGVMTGMVGFYLANTARKLDARPEDDPAARIEDVEGDYGFFSPHSWWPLPLAGAALLLFLGLAVGWWVFIVGFIFGVIALLGWTFEYYRGDIGI